MQQKTSFSELHPLTRPQEVTLGDGHILEATAEGTVMIETLLPDGSTKKCRLQDVLYIPKLSHNLRSVSKASEAGKSTAPGAKSSTRTTVIAFATRVVNLYYLESFRSQHESDKYGTPFVTKLPKFTRTPSTCRGLHGNSSWSPPLLMPFEDSSYLSWTPPKAAPFRGLRQPLWTLCYTCMYVFANSASAHAQV